MSSIAAALASARQLVPASEARLLLCHLIGRNTAWIEAHRDDALSRRDAEAFAALVERRACGEPVAYLLGFREFYGREFSVTPDVLIPRPETELLVDVVREKKVGGSDTANILDLVTGSGCVAITLALEIPAARVAAADISPAALAVARANATLLGAEVRFVESDWLECFAGQRFDCIVGNPPYVAADDPHLAEGDLRFEPPSALACGADGLDAIRRIIGDAARHLEAGGWLLLEHGYDQAAVLRELLAAAGFADIEQHRDLAGIVRVSGGRLTKNQEALN